MVASKLSKERVQIICDLLAKGMTRGAACSVADVHRDTMLSWLHEHTWVREAVLKAEAHCQELMLDQIRAAAGRITNNGSTQWQAAAWLLERRFPDDFRQRTDMSVSNPDGSLNPAMVAVLAPYSSMTSKELEREWEDLLRVSGLRPPAQPGSKRPPRGATDPSPERGARNGGPPSG